ncbi:MAG: 2OG-Fe(II) oxygenase [Methylophagaceae bacterium]
MLVNGKEAKDLSGIDLNKDQMIVIDDLFPQYIIEHTHDLVFSGYNWFYGHTSNYPEDPKTDVGSIPDWPEIPAFNQQIYPPQSSTASDSVWSMIYNAVAQLIPFELEVGEILVNGQQFIHNTTPHSDCDCDNGISWIYYVNREWKDEYGGETVIQLDGEWKKVYPKPGRVFLFKGKIPHHGLPPNDSYKGLRATLVYKTMRAKPLPAAQPWRT